MMFVPTPKTTTRAPFPKSRMLFKHFLSTMGLQHDFCLFKRIALGDIYLEMYVNPTEAKLTELESERFEFTESLGAGVDVGLFSETVVSTFGVKFHGYPVVSCVMRWLFIASATYSFHIVFCSCRTVYRAGWTACCVRQERNLLIF